MSGEVEATGFDPLGFVKLVRHYGHGGMLGIRYVAHGDDWCSLILPYDPRFTGVAETGVLASGPIISLMDMASSISTWIRSGRFRPQATLDLRVDYLRAAGPGRDIIGRAECYGLTRSVGFVRGIAHDGDESDPVANVTGTFMFTD